MIIIVGIPGCGKSSILKEALSHCPGAHLVNYGDKMIEEAAGDRDHLRRLPIEKQKQISRSAAQKIAKLDKGMTLLDTHALIATPNGFVPGLSREILEILNPRALALVECSPLLIVERRAQDASRKRDLETQEELALHQELTRAYMAACSMFTGALLCRLSNDGPSLSDNAAPLIRVLRAP